MNYHVAEEEFIDELKVSGALAGDQFLSLINNFAAERASGRNADILGILDKSNYLTNHELAILVAELCEIELFAHDAELASCRVAYIRDNTRHCSLHQYIEASYDDKRVSIVPADSFMLIYLLKQVTSTAIIICSQETYNTLLNRISTGERIAQTQLGLSVLNKFFSARDKSYPAIMLTFLFMAFGIYYLMPFTFTLASIGLFVLANIFKVLLLAVGAGYVHKEKKSAYVRTEWPIYSVLIALYKEAESIGPILQRLEEIDYPKDKLDVNLILEADDVITLKEIYRHYIPPYVNIIIVPDVLPKTKPKALNYAMDHVKGEYIVVYDAEDIPDSFQLKEAILTFDRLPTNYACLQARLKIYNSEETAISTCIAMEYDIWFGYFLRGLKRLNMPIPLGGTSNHFKVSVLREIGMWDSYNVTEDADLGIRLHMCGYKTAMLNSYTLEEGTIDVASWMKQRIRWTKGFMQSFIVYCAVMLNGGYSTYNTQLSIAARIHRLISHFSVWLFVGVPVYSYMIMPLLVWWSFSLASADLQLIWQLNYITFFILHYMSMIMLILYEIKLNSKTLPIVIVWPVYFILHVIACYIAVWELLVRPFKWDKTNHAISKVIYS